MRPAKSSISAAVIVLLRVQHACGQHMHLHQQHAQRERESLPSHQTCLVHSLGLSFCDSHCFRLGQLPPL